MERRIAVVGYRRWLTINEAAVEWIARDGRVVIRLPEGIRQHRIDRVVLVQADVSHCIVLPIVAACRSTGVALAFCGRPTQTQIRSTLDAFLVT